MKIRRKRIRTLLPVKTVCRNCSTQTMGRYCHVCGQDIFAGRGVSIFKLIGQLLENAFSLDNKTPVTLKYLLFRPGFLSSEYRLGRITRYVHPVKLFWMSTLIFFALLLGNVNFNDRTAPENEKKTTTEQAIGNESKTVLPAGAATAEKEAGTQVQKPGKEKIAEDLTDSEREMKNLFSTYGPYVAFLLIPVFALLLGLFFWRKKFYYMYHLVFAVHFHTFLWILFSLMIIANNLTEDTTWPTWTLVLLFLPGIYLMFAMARFYQPKWKISVVWKAVLLSLLYIILILLMVVLAVGIFFPDE